MSFSSLVRNSQSTAGKVSIFAVVLGIFLFVFTFLFDIGLSTDPIDRVAADEYATTSVTVLNTPPNWTNNAQEDAGTYGSSTSTPTNAGTVLTWIATATDDNAEAYYLLICRSSTTPTANSGAAPTCGGGNANLWNVSALTTSGLRATVSTTTYEALPERNDWVGWVCDANAVTPRCSVTQTGGVEDQSATNTTPFVVNHRPTFTAFVDDSPKLPGETVTWTATASDADVYGPTDTVKVIVCKFADFTGSQCGAGGYWASSTLSASNPATSTVLAIPLPDGATTSYGYVIDNHNFAASGGAHGTNSVLDIANATSTISAASISLNDTDGSGNLTLSTIGGTTTGFYVDFTVTDNNSCRTTTGSNEIATATINVYRSGIASTSCNVAGHHNVNYCYTDAVASTTWTSVCYQNASSCTGADDANVTWRCTFPFFFTADPTVLSSVYPSENWLTSVSAIDDDNATSSPVEGSSGNEMAMFMAYSLNTPSIAYGSLSPGQQNDPLFATTTLAALGNVGLDQTLYGTDMCPGYPATCSGLATSTIPVTEQKYATSSLSYAAGTSLALNPGVELELNVKKSTTTSTSTAAVGSTFWGIRVPGAITLAGDYYGLDTFIGVTGEAGNW